MQISFERRMPLLVGEPDAFRITLAGCGGTGSFLAQDLARLAYHARQQGTDVRLAFVDFDRVEEKNIGRQNFSPAEVGRYKAEALATRYSRAFGLDINYMTTAIKDAVVSAYPRHVNLLVGAVDNAYARRDIATTVSQANGRMWWLDCGNLHAAGQVILGNSAAWDSRSAFPGTGFCHSLPAPHILRPGLLTPQPKQTGFSCAELTQLDVQGLIVNRAIATFAAQYLYRLVVSRTLDIFMTVVDLDSGVSSSSPITASAIEAELAGRLNAVSGNQ